MRIVDNGLVGAYVSWNPISGLSLGQVMCVEFVFKETYDHRNWTDEELNNILRDI